MGGICGKIGFPDFTFGEPHLRRFSEGLTGPTIGPYHRIIRGPVMMGTKFSPGTHTGIKECSFLGQSLSLAFSGSLYNSHRTVPQEQSNPLDSLLEGFKEEGIHILNRIEGDFALAFWDEHSTSLYLAVDPIRIHPLYYYAAGDGLVFSSSLPALIKQPFCQSLPLNPRAISAMVTLSMIPTPETIFENIYKIPPGHFLKYSDNKCDLIQYWDLQFEPPHSLPSGTLKARTRDLVTQSVSSRLAHISSQAQVGAFLSGGIDSSTILGTLAHQFSTPVKCFSIGFDVEGFNELTYARIAAKAFHAEHFEYYVTPEDVLTAIPFLMKSFDEPFGNASAIPTLYCAKLAKDHGVDVLFAGDGGDELFAGNERYATQRMFDYYFLLPKILRENFLEKCFGSSHPNPPLALFRKITKYIQRANVPYPDRLLSWGIKDYTDQHEFWNPDFMHNLSRDHSILEYFRSHYVKAPATTALDRQLYIDLKLTLSDNDIPKVVKMTQAANLGVRFPFLALPLMEFAAKIPAKIKMRGLRLRGFFKNTYKDFLPKAVLQKSKHGFGLPVSVWLREHKPLNTFMKDVLLQKRFAQRGFITPSGLESVLRAHKTSDASLYGTIIWNLLILESWLEHHGR